MIDPSSLPFLSPAAWRGGDLQPHTDWIVPLAEAERDELRRVLDRLAGHPGALEYLGPSALGSPVLTPALRRWRSELQHGRGFVLVRGVPIEGYSREVLAQLYGWLGRALGEPVPQNGQGELVCDIRDTGADAADPDTRLYTTRAEQDFHTDGADIIGLLCLRGARSGGTSRIVSSVAVVREFVARRPDLVPLLFEPWTFRLHGHLPAGLPPTFTLPICRREGDHLATFFLGWYLRRAQELPGVTPWTAPQREAIELFERIANDPALTLDMAFEPGDIQWLKNSVILHKRASYEDWPEPGRKRHLLRLWLTARDFDDGDDRLRSGIDASALAVRPAERS